MQQIGENRMKKYDVLIIGAGIAGLYAAMNIPKEKKVLVVCKDIPWECNTFYAQGGIVTALDEDDIPYHIEAVSYTHLTLPTKA